MSTNHPDWIGDSPEGQRRFEKRKAIFDQAFLLAKEFIKNGEETHGEGFVDQFETNVEAARAFGERLKGSTMGVNSKLNGSGSIFIYDSFGETLAFAESLGWKDDAPDGCDPDLIEASALDFIREKGFVVEMEAEHE